MEYKVSVFNFDSKKHSKTIDEINNAPNGIEKEPFFKKIALDILAQKGFEKITEGPSISEFQGVPFDFIAMKDGCLSLIELKGSINTFNFSKEVQFARLFHVMSELKNRKIESCAFLLQVNTDLSLCQILDSKFYKIVFKNIDKSKGLKRPIIPIVDDLIKRMRKKGVKL